MPTDNQISQMARQSLELIRSYESDTVMPDLLERRLAISRAEAVAALKELSEAGYGRFILGRKGHSSRFELSAADVAIANEREFSSIKIAESERNEQVYLLMRSPPVQIRVPADLNAAEVERLCKWLHAIAIE